MPTVFERFSSDDVLSSMNTQMSRIDLIAEMLGPVIAGFVMAAAPTKVMEGSTDDRHHEGTRVHHHTPHTPSHPSNHTLP